MRIATRLMMVAIAAMTFGCGKKLDQPETITLDKVPASVMEAAKKELPKVTFESAWIEKEKGEVAYEVRGRDAAGKTRDVKVSTSGKILEVD
jgi:multidrug efflux pump subunit AcrA (membrane-fusion protein)